MSERLPRLIAREIINILERRGFTLARSSGSHHIYKNAAGKRVTVSVHGHEILHPKILQSILRDMDLTIQGLLDELRK
jgi:predicted RNA binding protein YcfA (HicA-like mRNA interferase family)